MGGERLLLFLFCFQAAIPLPLLKHRPLQAFLATQGSGWRSEWDLSSIPVITAKSFIEEPTPATAPTMWLCINFMLNNSHSQGASILSKHTLAIWGIKISSSSGQYTILARRRQRSPRVASSGFDVPSMRYLPGSSNIFLAGHSLG